MANETAKRTSIVAELKDALRGSDADYTKIGLKRAIFLLAIPMILELVMESTFAVVDIYFVGKLGASAIATVGITETFLFLLYSVAMGLATAVTALVARRVGEKNDAAVGSTVTQSLVIAALVSIPFAIMGLVYYRELLTVMGADEWTLNYGYGYAKWMLGGNIVIVLLFVINAIFRGAGDAAVAMRVLCVANIINIILDPILIFGWWIFPELGIEGAAIATTIGRGVGVLYQLTILLKGSNHLNVRFSEFQLQKSILVEIIKTSLGGVGQMIVAMTSWIFIMRILAEIGSEAVAGATITLRVIMFTMMPAWGLSNAAATLVGQNLGAGFPDRAESSVWKIGIYNMVFLIVVSIVYAVFKNDIVALFTSDPNVISVGAEWMQIIAYSYFIYGWWMVSVQAFNGAGDTKTPTYINLVFFWLIQIPLAWLLATQFQYGYTGVFWAIFISETAVGLFTLWLFTRGKWKTHHI